MLATERQEKICRLVSKNGAVTVASLVSQFGVSIETVRRDLMLLEKLGKLSRVHGGAIKKGDMKPFLSLPARNKENNEQKIELSRKAMQFICENDIILVDTGSTAIIFAEALKKNFEHLTVITHSLDVFELLRAKSSFKLILLGGLFLDSENAFYGSLCSDMLDMIHAQKAFIFPSAISLEHGIGDYQQELFEIQRKMFNCADKVFVLADSSKFEKKALLKLSDTSSAYSYITDSSLAHELYLLYTENEIKIY